MPFASYEFLDEVGDNILRLIVEHRMVGARNLSVFGSGYALGQVAPARDWDQHIAHAMENQCRYSDRRQNMAYV
jgi:hypothetical protein